MPSPKSPAERDNTGDKTPFSHEIVMAELPSRKESRVTLVPEAADLAAMTTALDLTALRKMRFEVTLAPMGKTDWHLTAQLGATVVQPCVVTLEPVTTRIEDKIERIYLAQGFETADTQTGGTQTNDIEIPDDDRLEPLSPTLDLGALAVEALALALPAYPRAADAALKEAVFTEPGKAPMTDKDARPFAGLAALRDQLKDPE